jgi:hypothetical protein
MEYRIKGVEGQERENYIQYPKTSPICQLLLLFRLPAAYRYASGSVVTPSIAGNSSS